MLPGIAQALAEYYGYRTLYSLIGENFGLIIIITAFIAASLVFMRLLNRQFPQQGKEPMKTWVFKVTIIFFISAFVFICCFTVFYEHKRADSSSGLSETSAEVYRQV